MEKVILKKENGNIIESKRKVLGGKKSYVTNEDGMLASTIDFSKIEKIKKAEINEIEIAFNRIFDSLTKLNNSKKVYESMNVLKQIKTRNELLELTRNMFEEYKHFYMVELSRKSAIPLFDSVNETLSTTLENNPDLVMAVFTKRLILFYYQNKIRSLGDIKVNVLENFKLNGVSTDYMFEIIGETFPSESISNGIYMLSKKLFADSIDIVFDDLQKHLCALDCANLLKCPKVIEKRKIGSYNFINSGYQTFNQDGTLDRFIVTDCKYYEKEEPRVLTTVKKRKNES